MISSAGRNATRYAAGDIGERPWGRWEVLAVGPGYIVKRVTVEPERRLSLQYHRHRAEHWMVVAGQAEVELEGQGLILDPTGRIDIPPLCRHRVRALGPGALVFIEIQTGAPDEADIVRLSDDYGRG